MEIKFTHLLMIIVSLSVTYSCDTVAEKKDETNLKENESGASEFEQFLSNFILLELPESIQISCRDSSIKEDKDNEIERSTAIKYLCQGDSSKINQPSGGIFQYYYGYRFEGPDKLPVIVYLRPSYNHYSGFILATFNPEGVLINELFLSGILGEEGQKEAQIEKNFNIIQEEIRYSFPGVGHYETIPCKVTERKFKIFPEGKIKKLSEEEETFDKCILEDDCGYISKP